MGRTRSWGAGHPCGPGIVPSPRCDPVLLASRSHHSILYAGLGSASSARSDEQARAGVDLKRVQRERGPVKLWSPAPAHPARRAFTVSPEAPRTCRVRTSATSPAAAELRSVAGGRTPDPFHTRRVATTLTTHHQLSPLGSDSSSKARTAQAPYPRLSLRRRTTSVRVSTSGPLSYSSGIPTRIGFTACADHRPAIFVLGAGSSGGGPGRGYRGSISL